MVRYTVFLFTLFVVFLLLGALPAYADGTVSGMIVGPHGETSAVSYTFTQSGTTVTGTTNSSGVFSQSLANGDWSFTATPPAAYTYADTFTIPTIRITDNVSFALGTMQFHFQVPTGTDSDLEQFASEPAVCSQTGTPVIIRAYYEDEQKGSFLYATRAANVIVVTDGTGDTVQVDYSYIEGNYSATLFSNANTETATHQGNGKYKATHTVALTSSGGGMPIIRVTRSGSSTHKCLAGGPVNLDIRSYFTGSSTTNFQSVSDFRAIENFTMHQDGVVKITFSRSVNMLDPTVQRFMKSIAAKMVSAKGSVNLDAKAVLELKNAGASITWYGLTSFTSTPTILLDGAEAGSAVSNLTYDQSAGTLTFTAAHFSAYAAVPTINVSTPQNEEKTSHQNYGVRGSVTDKNATVRIFVGPTDQGTVTVDSNGNFEKTVQLLEGRNTVTVRAANSGGNALNLNRVVTLIRSPTSCDHQTPFFTPEITQIKRTGKQALIYIPSTSESITHYAVLYGYAQKDERFGATLTPKTEKGFSHLTVDSLSPSQTYYFKVQAVNKCKGSPWSKLFASRPYSNWVQEGAVAQRMKKTTSEVKPTAPAVKKLSPTPTKSAPKSRSAAPSRSRSIISSLKNIFVH